MQRFAWAQAATSNCSIRTTSPVCVCENSGKIVSRGHLYRYIGYKKTIHLNVLQKENTTHRRTMGRISAWTPLLICLMSAAWDIFHDRKAIHNWLCWLVVTVTFGIHVPVSFWWNGNRPLFLTDTGATTSQTKTLLRHAEGKLYSTSSKEYHQNTLELDSALSSSKYRTSPSITATLLPSPQSFSKVQTQHQRAPFTCVEFFSSYCC